MRHLIIGTATSALAVITASRADPSVQTFFNDKAGWESASGVSTATIDFVSPTGQNLLVGAGYYAQLGVTLSDYYETPGLQWELFPGGPPSIDGWWGAPAGFAINSPAFNFSGPRHAFGWDKFHYFDLFETNVSVLFYSEGLLLGTYSVPEPPQTPDGMYFHGWVTDFSFDRVVLYSDRADNIYFEVVPAPAGSLVVGIVALLGRSRRRR
ncbi:MAG: hypothetical protein U0572_18140 [Phycisphaerales bacterium]